MTIKFINTKTGEILEKDDSAKDFYEWFDSCMENKNLSLLFD